MIGERVKRLLLAVLGERGTAWLQAVRFVYLIREQRFRDPEVDLLPSFLKRGDVAVDVGANGANWTCYLHEAVAPEGSVYAFEADPYYARATERAMRFLRLHRARLFPFGLSERRERAALRVREPGGARASGLAYVDKSAALESPGTEVIALESLDSLVGDHPDLARVAFIKCDTEGYEWYVFRGAECLLRQARPAVLLEVGHFERQNYTAANLNAWFEERGYAGFALTAGGAGEDESRSTSRGRAHREPLHAPRRSPRRMGSSAGRTMTATDRPDTSNAPWIAGSPAFVGGRCGT
jgi:FkbM family methyltransferase